MEGKGKSAGVEAHNLVGGCGLGEAVRVLKRGGDEDAHYRPFQTGGSWPQGVALHAGEKRSVVASRRCGADAGGGFPRSFLRAAVNIAKEGIFPSIEVIH